MCSLSYLIDMQGVLRKKQHAVACSDLSAIALAKEGGGLRIKKKFQQNQRLRTKLSEPLADETGTDTAITIASIALAAVSLPNELAATGRDMIYMPEYIYQVTINPSPS